MKIELWPISRLKRYAKNPRKEKTISKAVEAVAASIKEFGFRQPIVVDENDEIIAGHTRYEAAQFLGLKKVPVHVARGLTPEQVKAYRIADNQVADLTTWDLKLLPIELESLTGAGYDLAPLGFSRDELTQIFAAGRPRLCDPDEVSVPPAKARSRPGDLYELGDHRILCGDSTNGDDVARLFDGAEPFLMVTDPPYGVEYDADWRAQHHAWGPPATRKNVENDGRSDWTEAYQHFPGKVVYLWHASVLSGLTWANLTAAGFTIRYQIIWDKERAIMSRGAYHWQHEPCWYATRGGGAKWAGGRKQTTIWAIPGMHVMDREEDREAHPTQKPVECMARPIRNHGGADDHVYDPFLGSGTTMIAAEMNGRRCYGMELEPAFVDVAVARWEKFTGQKAKRTPAVKKPARKAGGKTNGKAPRAAQDAK